MFKHFWLRRILFFLNFWLHWHWLKLFHLGLILLFMKQFTEAAFDGEEARLDVAGADAIHIGSQAVEVLPKILLVFLTDVLFSHVRASTLPRSLSNK